jgi:hypothetical protein
MVSYGGDYDELFGIEMLKQNLFFAVLTDRATWT